MWRPVITSKMEVSIKMKYLATGGKKNGLFVEGKGRLYKDYVFLTISVKSGIVISCPNKSISHLALKMTVLRCLIIIPRS